jgi:hypothetical protein
MLAGDFEDGRTRPRLQDASRMQTQTRSFRLAAALAVPGLVLAQSPPSPALAQGAPSPQAGLPDQPSGDPPARVGRLARVSGTVSFHAQDQDRWSPAVANYPVTAGNAFWTQPDAQAVIEVSASRIVMAPSTELDIAGLTDTAFQGTTPQGELYLHLVPVAQGESYAVQTPRGLVTLAEPGRYGIVAGDTESPTLVTAIEGSAHVEGPGVGVDVGPQQTASITGNDAFQAMVGQAQRDPFLTTALAGDRSPGVAAPPGVAAMPGGNDLAQHGSWAPNPEYGQVWYPQVAPGWVPYREGSWAYVEPWGWTWVDAEPWGFAPFHYGRWVETGGRWGWVPGAAAVTPVPVYAPALVTFLGVGAAVGLGVGIGAVLAEGRVGWCPLGPHEPYHPWYRASDRYFRRLNVTHVTNIATINRNVTINNFVNRQATTVVPAAVMTASRPVSASVQRVDPAQLAQARPVVGQQPLRPAAGTLGVTPAVARQLNLPYPAPFAQRVAPGPAIHGSPFMATGPVAGAVPGRQALPALHGPAQTRVPAAAMAHPYAGTPALRTPPAPGQIAPPAIQHNAGGTPAIVTHAPQPPVSEPGTPPGGIAHTVPLTTAPPPAVSHAPPLVNHPPPQELYRGGTPAGITRVVPPVVAPPPPVTRVPPPVVAHAPPPELHMPPPVVHTPPAMVHAAPPPSPPPQVHAPPPPAAPRAPPQVQNAPHRRPGEP